MTIAQLLRRTRKVPYNFQIKQHSTLSQENPSFFYGIGHGFVMLLTSLITKYENKIDFFFMSNENKIDGGHNIVQ